MTAATPILTYNRAPSAPRLALPAGACDAHVHVFGPQARFPYAPERGSTPADAPKETLFALHRQLGIARCVVVQSLVHGYDNRVVEDAIAAGGGRYLGVALVPLSVSDAELARLAAAGMRGLRFHFMPGQGAAPTVQEVVQFSRRLVPLDMHLQVHCDGSVLPSLLEPLARSAVPVVIDHMGRVDAAHGLADAGFTALRRMLRDARFHVKLSGIDRITRRGDYAPGLPFARALLQEYPAQCFWGTDWPHPNHDHVPDDGRLVDLLAEIAPDAALREALLVHNPQRFYRFAA